MTVMPLDVSTVSKALYAGKMRAADLIELFLDRISAIDGRLGAFAAINPEDARAAARRADKALVAGQWSGPLHGIPFGVKDLIATADLPTEVGMPILRSRQTGYDATSVTRLRGSGAILIGKLTQTEGTFGGYHPDAVIPTNPWNPALWPGASSSGPAVAVAARLCPIALASDTGGSIRAPAAACGITGLMPSQGRVSRHGAFPLAPTLDRIGPFATSALDCAHVLRAIAGVDPADPAALDEPVPDYASQLGTGLRGLRLGFDEGILDDCDPEIGSAIDNMLTWFDNAGMRIFPCKIPESRPALEGWVDIVAAGAAEAHREFYRGNEGRYGKELAGLVELGMRTSATAISRAVSRQLDLTGAMTNLHREIDAMLVPVSLRQTPTVKSYAERPGIRQSYPAGGQFTGIYSLTGQPTITFPTGFTAASSPIGLQLAGAHFAEPTLLHLVHKFQQATDWHLRVPPL